MEGWGEVQRRKLRVWNWVDLPRTIPWLAKEVVSNERCREEEDRSSEASDE